jgi:hypothetical protein
LTDIDTSSGDGVHGSNAESWSVTNEGKISGNFSFGVDLLGGGSVTNDAGRTITGGYPTSYFPIDLDRYRGPSEDSVRV